jgi:hypothetical protein
MTGQGSTIGVGSRRDDAPGANRPQPSRTLVVDEVPPSALIEVGCVGAVFDHFEVRLFPECPTGRDCSGKELTADATIAPARRDEQPGHLRSVMPVRCDQQDTADHLLVYIGDEGGQRAKRRQPSGRIAGRHGIG